MMAWQCTALCAQCVCVCACCAACVCREYEVHPSAACHVYQQGNLSSFFTFFSFFLSFSLYPSFFLSFFLRYMSVSPALSLILNTGLTALPELAVRANLYIGQGYYMSTTVYHLIYPLALTHTCVSSILMINQFLNINYPSRCSWLFCSSSHQGIQWGYTFPLDHMSKVRPSL